MEKKGKFYQGEIIGNKRNKTRRGHSLRRFKKIKSWKKSIEKYKIKISIIEKIIIKAENKDAYRLGWLKRFKK